MDKNKFGEAVKSQIPPMLAQIKTCFETWISCVDCPPQNIFLYVPLSLKRKLITLRSKFKSIRDSSTWKNKDAVSLLNITRHGWSWKLSWDERQGGGGVCLSVYLSIYLSVYLSVCLSVYLFIYLSAHPSFFLTSIIIFSFFFPSINPSICPVPPAVRL